MSTDIVSAGQFTTPGVVEQKIQYARTLAGAGMIPDAYKNQPQNIFAAIEYGQALGMAPIEAVMKVNVIKGRASLGADAMAALVRRAGHRLRVTTNSPESVTAVIIRADDPDFEYTVTWDRAKAERAGLWGQRGPWSQYPDQMLRNRAISEVCRQAASDALAGVIYTPEEVESIPDRAAPPRESERPAPAPSAEEIEACEDMTTLRNWWTAFGEAHDEQMQAAVAARADALKAAHDSEPAVEPEIVEEDADAGQEELPVLDGEIVEESES